MSHHTAMMTRLHKIFGPPKSEWDAKKSFTDDLPGLFKSLHHKEILGHSPIVIVSMCKKQPLEPVVTPKEFLEPHRDPDVGPNELKTYCMRNNCFSVGEELQATFRCRGLLSYGKEKELAAFKKNFFMGTEVFDRS